MKEFNINMVWLLPIAIIAIALIGSSVTIIPAGERGVVKTWGAVTGNIFNEGLNFKVPLMQSVDKFNVKTQKIETGSAAASKDLQIVTASIAVNYKLNPTRVTSVRQNIGRDKEYQGIIVDPAIQEAIKAASAQFTAEELITKRPAVREAMKLALQEKLNALSDNSITVEEFNIVNFDFSSEFNKAIEAKVVAEQSALAAKNKLEQVKFEAQQAKEAAIGRADAISIESKALRENPDILQLRAIEKWTGRLPLFMGSGSEPLPFIDVKPEALSELEQSEMVQTLRNPRHHGTQLWDGVE